MWLIAKKRATLLSLEEMYTSRPLKVSDLVAGKKKCFTWDFYQVVLGLKIEIWEDTVHYLVWELLCFINLCFFPVVNLILIYNKWNSKEKKIPILISWLFFYFQESNLSKLLRHLQMLIESYIYFFSPFKGFGTNVLLNLVRGMSQAWIRVQGMEPSV